MQRFASFDGTAIAYTTAGSGPDALLLHGFAADHYVNWVAPGVVDALVAAGRRVIALDARGHGRSDTPHDPHAYEKDAMAPDARALLDHLAVDHVDVIGYSMGALVSTRLVPDEPRARSCVLGGIGAGVRGGRGFSAEGRARLADALETDDVAGVTDASARAFRSFADHTGADRFALAVPTFGVADHEDPARRDRGADARHHRRRRRVGRLAAGSRRSHPERGGTRP